MLFDKIMSQKRLKLKVKVAHCILGYILHYVCVLANVVDHLGIPCILCTVYILQS